MPLAFARFFVGESPPPRASVAVRFLVAESFWTIGAAEPLAPLPLLMPWPLGSAMDFFFLGIGEEGSPFSVCFGISKPLMGFPAVSVLVMGQSIAYRGNWMDHLRLLYIKYEVHSGVLFILIDDGQETVNLDAYKIVSLQSIFNEAGLLTKFAELLSQIIRLFHIIK